jgi:hypothetical protein
MTTQVLVRYRRVTAVLTLAALVLAGSTSCTPEIKGITGLTVDEHGQVLAALAWCAPRPPTVVSVRAIQPQPTAAQDDASHAAGRGMSSLPDRMDYPVPAGVTSPTMMPLGGFPPTTATSHSTFDVYGMGRGSSPSGNFGTRAVWRVQLTDLAELTPELILTTTYVGERVVQHKVSLQEFAHRGERLC